MSTRSRHAAISAPVIRDRMPDRWTVSSLQDISGPNARNSSNRRLSSFDSIDLLL